MILTGKAKEDFIDYLWQSKFNKDDYKDYEDYINNQKESHTYADIIKWFDSVGIYIDTQLVVTFEESEITKVCWFINIATSNGCYNSDESYESRPEATKQAILKANQIYNDR